MAKLLAGTSLEDLAKLKEDSYDINSDYGSDLDIEELADAEVRTEKGSKEESAPYIWTEEQPLQRIAPGHTAKHRVLGFGAYVTDYWAERCNPGTFDISQLTHYLARKREVAQAKAKKEGIPMPVAPKVKERYKYRG